MENLVENTPIEGQQPQNEEIVEPNEEVSEIALNDLIFDVKQEYEKKLFDLDTQYKQQIKERDSIIKQLLTSDKPTQEESIADMVNKNRSFKKW